MARRKATLTPDDLKIGPGTSKLDLSSLFAAGTSRDTVMQHPIMVGIEYLLDNPYQPRLDANETSLDELAEVIRQQGFQGVLVARQRRGIGDQYELTAGHRRREAARRAGLRVLPVVVQELTDEEMVVRAITENIQREDLSPLEEGRIYQLMQQEMGYSYRQIAREVGKKLGYVQNRIRVAQAPPDVQAMVRARPETLHAVRYLVDIESEALRGEIIRQLLAGALTNDDLRSYAEIAKRESSNSDLTPVPTGILPEKEGPLPTSFTRDPEASFPGSNLSEDSTSKVGEESSGGHSPADLSDTAHEPPRPPDTGPLLVPKGDGSGGFLVVPKDHAKPVHPSTAEVAAAVDGDSAGLSSYSPSNPGAAATQASDRTLLAPPIEDVEKASPLAREAAPSAGGLGHRDSGSSNGSGSRSYGVPREAEDLNIFRLRRTKLASALRALRAYRGILTSDEQLTKEEREYLQEIVSLADEFLNGKVKKP